MNEMTLEERDEDLETAVYNLIQMVNKLREQSEVIDVIIMDKELKAIREKRKVPRYSQKSSCFVKEYEGRSYMIIITNEMLLNAFGNERVPFSKDLFMHSLKSLIEREEYGKDITSITQYEPQWNPQEYVDNWMNSTIAKTEVAEYYKNLSFKGEDNMNKYETLLKKYQALYKDFETYRQVTEDIADKGTYVTNEALAELLECKKKYEDLKKENDSLVYMRNEKEKEVKRLLDKCDEAHTLYLSLKEDNNKLRNTIDDIYEGKRKLKEEYDGLKMEKDNLYKSYSALKKERDDLVKEVYYLHEVINEKNSKCKEKMDKIKQRDKQITELIAKNNKLHSEHEAIRLALVKERDNLAKRLEHINAMSNLEWEFEVVEETETTRTPYDELVEFCGNREGSCTKCPNVIACDGINGGFRPARWNEDENAEYNELIAMSGKEDK